MFLILFVLFEKQQETRIRFCKLAGRMYNYNRIYNEPDHYFFTISILVLFFVSCNRAGVPVLGEENLSGIEEAEEIEEDTSYEIVSRIADHTTVDCVYSGQIPEAAIVSAINYLHIGYGDGPLDHDCGYHPGWANETREFLDDPENVDINVIMWSLL